MCAAEFICEYLGMDISDKDYRYKSRNICRIMREMPGWEEAGVSRHVEFLYGRQKSFKRDKKITEDDNL